MSFKNIVQLACAAIVIGASAGAQATTVNFNDQPVNYFNINFVSDGYRFVTSGPFGYAVTSDQQACSPECPLSGSVELLLPFGPSSVTMTAANGAAFSLGSFLGAGTFDQNSNEDPTSITVVGQLASGGTVSESFNIVASGSGPLPFTLETANASFAVSQVPSLSLYGAYCTNIDITCLPGGARVLSRADAIVHSTTGFRDGMPYLASS